MLSLKEIIDMKLILRYIQIKDVIIQMNYKRQYIKDIVM